jgi:hypothetical protein
VDRNKTLFFAIIFSFALAILLSEVYPFDNHKTDFAQAQMMPSTMPTTTPPPNDQTTLPILIAIVIATITLIVLVLYLILSRKRETLHGNPHVYTSIRKENSPAQSQTAAIREASKPFQAFLCYKKSSGKDYADHLKAGLEEVGLHTFEDCKDIPLTVDTEEGWSRLRDRALSESIYFILIMTPGFDLSSEVIKEISFARKQMNKTFVFFRHRSMGRKIVVNLGDEVLDIGQLEQVSFESKEELLRLALNILKGKSK